MIKLFLQSKILISIWIISITMILSLFFFIPFITEKNITELVVENSKNSVEQIKLTRTYYLDSVVSDIKKHNPNMKFLVDHINDEKALPLPATLIHDLGEIYSKNSGIKFRTYSDFPFKNREDRVLSKKDKEVLEKLEKSNGLVVLKDEVANKPVLKVAIADYMSESSCVKCHNNHPNKTWDSNKWKVGDIRGVIEIITPLEEPIKRNKQMRNMILAFISLLFLLLIIYYSYMLVKREDELLKINEILDKKVKEEIAKNREKEQVLVQKAKLSSMGEMINSIAHQWRQPLSELSSLLMNIELRYRLGKLDKDFLESKMNKSEVILEFMSNTIEDFRSFFKIDKKKTSFTLRSVFDDSLNILQMSLSNNDIKIDLNIDEDIQIYGYKNELSQVILNLLVNSKEELIRKEIENPKIDIEVKSIDARVEISIKDNAKGIDKDLLDKVFDLYFTTKKNGSGIGLYISKIIIEKHFLGKLEVQNVKDGIEFKIVLDRKD